MNYKQKSSRYLWLPFTQMKEYDETPLVISHGEGVLLTDTDGKQYYDANSSVWLNPLGHNHPELNAAVTDQLQKIAHSTSLGMANVPAVDLAERLVALTPAGLDRVFYSDSGATAVEIGIKMAFQYWLNCGVSGRTKFVTMHNGYHGDTVGTISVGDIDIYHKIYQPLMFDSFSVPYPDVYHHPSQDPEQVMAESLAALEATLRDHQGEIASVIVEPLMQGAGGMIAMPTGYLRRMRELCTTYDVLLICDEVAVGFGRTGKLFACQHEDVVPDILTGGKMLTGGYLPVAITMTSQKIYDAFYDDYTAMKTLFHGHSYTGNQLGCAVALKNLEIYERDQIVETVAANTEWLGEQLDSLRELAVVGDIRQVGYMIGIELVKDRQTCTPFATADRFGWRATLAMRDAGLLTRPLGDTVVFMPPLVSTRAELTAMIACIRQGISAVMAEEGLS